MRTELPTSLPSSPEWPTGGQPPKFGWNPGDFLGSFCCSLEAPGLNLRAPVKVFSQGNAVIHLYCVSHIRGGGARGGLQALDGGGAHQPH